MNIGLHKYIAACVSLVLLTVINLQTAAQTGDAEPVNLYSTAFEKDEGFDRNYTLIGQGGWVGFGTGGNGLVENAFTGQGQQAYIGYSPPETNGDYLSVWHPIDFTPGTNANNLVQFSVWMSIIDSTYANYDDFRWSVYNTAEERLFTVDFDNAALLISYSLDNDAGFVSTGLNFETNTLYELTINMNFQSNRWNAYLGNYQIVPAREITTKGAELTLGDIDAVWAIRNPAMPGDNYMLFDNYKISVLNPTNAPLPNPGTLHLLGYTENMLTLKFTGSPDKTYNLQASQDLLNWSTIKTFTVPNDGEFDYIDTAVPGNSKKFYRTKWTPETGLNAN
ncbi:MAG: hypothetical protein K9N48_08515 [Verrucomicrobia bacterium]|nr:hypothetical protein [Verrucomicrobiota bacterium]MCF7708220.1 hypothetical protein [Verrucomicrobiota bacterium]